MRSKKGGLGKRHELLLFSAQPRASCVASARAAVLRVAPMSPPPLFQNPMFQAPTSPGVYWRGDVRWIKYPPAVGARILERHETQNTGFVNIGPVRTSRGDYMVDLTHNVQISPRGIKRKVLVLLSTSSTSATSTHGGKKDKAPAEVSCFGIVWNKRKKDEKNATRAATKKLTGAGDARASTGNTVGYGPTICAAAFIAGAAAAHLSSRVSAPPSISAEDRALLALMDRIKGLYFHHVNHFLEEGAKHHKKLGKEPPTFVIRKNMWDLQCAQLRKFLELAKKHGASESDPRVLFGYHGTSAENAEKIILEGFRPGCRRSNAAGAYFSGELEFSAKYARDHHGLVSKNSARPTSKPEGPGDILLVVLLLDGHLKEHVYGDLKLRGHPTKQLINVAQCVFDEKYAMPLARLRGF